MGEGGRRFGHNNVVTSLSPGATYVFQVRGKYNTLVGQPSAEATGATAGAAYVPDVPSGVTATPTIGGGGGPHLDPT